MSFVRRAKNPYLAKAFHCRFELEDFDNMRIYPGWIDDVSGEVRVR